MTAEGIIVPTDIKEIEPIGKIEITRIRISGANMFGKPEGEIEDKRTFQSPGVALDWTRESPGYSHRFEIPLPDMGLSAYLIGEQGSRDEKLVVSKNDNIRISPRSVAGHHSVSTDYQSFFYLNIQLESRQSALFDRGIVWVGLGDSPGLIFHINPGKHTKEELVEGINKMLQRVKTVTNDLLSGESR